jgi:hypothetical protein
VQKLSNPPEICQKLGTRQKYFLPARQLSNPPELLKSGGENRHLATLGVPTTEQRTPALPDYFFQIRQI